MLASISVPEGSDLDVQPEIKVFTSDEVDLASETRFGLDIRATVDLANPDRWSALSITGWSASSQATLRAMIGEKAVRQLARMRKPFARGQQSLQEEISLDTNKAGPWLRIAALDALDRWVHLPLDQSLVDAERGVVRNLAASTLPDGEFRRGLVGEALTIARGAAAGLTQYLSEVVPRAQSLPLGLHTAIGDLVHGYDDLLAQVDGKDSQLRRVVQVWARQDHRSASANPSRRPIARQKGFGGAAPGPVKSVIDPRQIRARVVAIGADPTSAEVAISAEGLADNLVLVTVPAYSPKPPARSIADSLLVRLVDQRGEAHGAGLLTLTASGFQGLIPLLGSDAADVRADIFDVDSVIPPASVDTDEDLQRVRRATAFLREWRRIISEARLPHTVANPSQRLRDIAGLLTGGPAFHGGPSAADLNSLADSDAPDLEAALRDQDGQSIGSPSIRRWFAATQGSGALLVAELAAADQATKVEVSSGDHP